MTEIGHCVVHKIGEEHCKCEAFSDGVEWDQGKRIKKGERHENVRQEAWLIGWLLNLKRLAAIQARATA